MTLFFRAVGVILLDLLKAVAGLGFLFGTFYVIGEYPVIVGSIVLFLGLVLWVGYHMEEIKADDERKEFEKQTRAKTIHDVYIDLTKGKEK